MSVHILPLESAVFFDDYDFDRLSCIDIFIRYLVSASLLINNLVPLIEFWIKNLINNGEIRIIICRGKNSIFKFRALGGRRTLQAHKSLCLCFVGKNLKIKFHFSCCCFKFLVRNANYWSFVNFQRTKKDLLMLGWK